MTTVPLFRSVCQVLVIALPLLCAPGARAAPPAYSALALSSGNSQAFGLNRLGDVTVWADDLGGYTGAWVDGALVPVPLGTGGRPTRDGRVGVLVDNGDGRQRPGLYHLRTGITTEVGPPHSLPPMVMDANTAGVAVGCVSEAPPNAKVYLGGAEVDLGQGCVNAVTQEGAVAGTLLYYDPVQDRSVWRAFGTGPGQSPIQWIPPFEGGVWSEAHDIRDGLVVGTSDLQDGSGSQAFVHTLRTGRSVPLSGLGGSWSGALSARQGARVVGWASLPGDVDFRAVLWLGHARAQVFDLNDLADVPAGWTLYEAVDINRKGWIVANAMDASGNTKGFLLKPRPARGAAASQAAQRPAVTWQRLCGAQRGSTLAVACRSGDRR